MESMVIWLREGKAAGEFLLHWVLLAKPTILTSSVSTPGYPVPGTFVGDMNQVYLPTTN